MTNSLLLTKACIYNLISQVENLLAWIVILEPEQDAKASFPQIEQDSQQNLLTPFEPDSNYHPGSEDSV